MAGHPGSLYSNSTSLQNTTIPFVLSDEEWRQRLDTVLLYNFLGLVGFILNLLPILLTFCTEMRHKLVNVMVANLSTADLLCCFTFVLGQWRYIMYREQIDGDGCRWMGFVSFTTSFYEFSFPAFLAVNRYVSLYASQQRYDRIYSAKNIRYMIIGWWAFCIVIPLTFTLAGKTGFDEDNLHCCITVKTTSPVGWAVFYWFTIMIPLITVCDGTMMFCNYKIYKKLHNHAETRTLKQNVVRQHKEILYFLIADMVTPVCIYAVYHVSKFALYDRTDIVQRRVFTCLYLLNSCIRGAITLTMLRPYRRALMNVFGWVCCWKVLGEVEPMNSSQMGSACVVTTQNGSTVRTTMKSDFE